MKVELQLALEQESTKFQECYLWLEKAMPKAFFQETTSDNLFLITHNLMGFALQEYFSTINLRGGAIVLCMDTPEADLRILENYGTYGIKNYQTFVSSSPPPLATSSEKLRIALITFTDADEPLEVRCNSSVTTELEKEGLSIKEIRQLFCDLGGRFVHTLPEQTLLTACKMYLRARARDSCQYETHLEDQERLFCITLAWKNTPKSHFLFRLARVIYRHHLTIQRVNASYVHPYSRENILVMALELRTQSNASIASIVDVQDFLREFVTVKYFSSFDRFEETLVRPHILSGNMANVLRAISIFVHQILVAVDPNLYSLDNVEEGLCRHPELTALLCEAFRWKFHPQLHNYTRYEETKKELLELIFKLDTGQEEYDTRRKQILGQAVNMVNYCLKTNAYRNNFVSLCFRMDPHYLEQVPFDRQKKFPDLPFAVFFVKGMHYFGFHIRFRDLARGGLRTIFPEQTERMLLERNTVFAECYQLAYTQQLKNKDIPEGGAKGVIFLKPYASLDREASIYKQTLEKAQNDHIEEKLAIFHKEQTLEYLYQAQRSFVDGLITLVNCEPDGTLRARWIIDYWNQPEYLYLGPDENMHDSMIHWIAHHSLKYNYKPGSSFISGKPKFGINHKEYGVTSLGVHVYVEQLLKHIGIDPKTTPFRVKMSGGPDGDVAGNEILNLARDYPHTAKMVAITDVSGTIHDPEGLDLQHLSTLFHKQQPIRFYPPEKLHEGGFLIDKRAKKESSSLAQQTLCWRKRGGILIQDWLSSSDTNHLLRDNVHKTPADVFIPAGGRPRMLNEGNYREFLDEMGRPTAKIIVEGANLYLTPQARRELEKLGVWIVKDSSANKTGVICSSFEVLCGLALGDELFYEHKAILVEEILQRLRQVALSEAKLLLKESSSFLTEVSNKISERIHLFTDQILQHLEQISLSSSPEDPLTNCFLSYCLPTLRSDFLPQLLENIPTSHKKAIIACHIGAELVYRKGIHWQPSVVDVLPLALEELAL